MGYPTIHDPDAQAYQNVVAYAALVAVDLINQKDLCIYGMSSYHTKMIYKKRI